MATGERQEPRELAIDGELIVLPADEIDRLLDVLARLRESDADAVREQIGALRLLSGTIQLSPTEPELFALRAALAALGHNLPTGTGTAP
jgi:hypothetical protein